MKQESVHTIDGCNFEHKKMHNSRTETGCKNEQKFSQQLIIQPHFSEYFSDFSCTTKQSSLSA